MSTPRELFTAFQQDISIDSTVFKYIAPLYLSIASPLPLITLIYLYIHEHNTVTLPFISLSIEVKSYLITPIVLFVTIFSVFISIFVCWRVIKPRLENLRIGIISFKSFYFKDWQNKAIRGWQKVELNKLLNSNNASLSEVGKKKNLDEYIKYAEERVASQISPYFKPAVFLAFLIPLYSYFVKSLFGFATNLTELFQALLLVIVILVSCLIVYATGAGVHSAFFNQRQKQGKELIDLLKELKFENELNENKPD